MLSAIERLNSHLDQQFTEQLNGIKALSRQPTQTPGVAWHRVLPTAVSSPKLIAHFQEVAQLLELQTEDFESPELIEWLAGNVSLKNAVTYSACYGGHQFGHWAGQLGDGRAITIAELEVQSQRVECQLKGAGPTPYSRSADGRAVLRSSIREFLCSEAMHHLGVPTTRALSLVSTGDNVVRDILYNGNPQAEPGAIVCRVAPSFVRFGNFEIFASREEHQQLKQFIDFVINRDFSKIANANKGEQQKYAAFFCEVCTKTAEMIVNWHRVGFVHGVMNTDNMSILGLTIDYGPYGWLDNFDSDWTPNTTDAQNRRYRFGNQPGIARWNLICLANALSTIISDLEIFKTGIQLYDLTLNEKLYQMQCDKFGLVSDKDSEEDNGRVIENAYQLMQTHRLDFTLFFDKLTEHTNNSNATVNELIDELSDTSYSANDTTEGSLQLWLEDYVAIIKKQNMTPDVRYELMLKTNPKFILRNYLAQQAIEKAEQGDASEVKVLMDLLRSPYKKQEGFEDYYKKRPKWAEHKVGCSMLSCSS
ncbi:MAG: YdiU family protein [Gammaproteobacteria bacterium]|nr:YdiU family protein [Gammaproteobacteria bacterium]